MKLRKEKKTPLNIDKGLLFEYHRGNVSSKLYNAIGKQLIKENRITDLTSNHLNKYMSLSR